MAGPTFARRVIDWGRAHGRSDLPWQREPTPYRVWVSEIMLQQTRVETVLGYFERFMAAFPTVEALAEADADAVLARWSGLGYYARARNLHRAAKEVVARHGGEVPADMDALTALPGIGRSTAGAILSLAHGVPAAILDGNVRRVLARYHGLLEDPASGPAQRRLWAWAEEKLPARKEVGAYTQHLMDLGALRCTPQAPDCARCPLQDGCSAHRDGTSHRIPMARRRRDLPLRTMRMYLLTNPQRRVCLVKRPPAGLWGGLWSLPENCEPERILTRWPVVRHTFTHFHLDIEPVVAHPGPGHEAGEWFTIDDALGKGLPAPVRRLLERLQAQEPEPAHDPYRSLQETG